MQHMQFPFGTVSPNTRQVYNDTLPLTLTPFLYVLPAPRRTHPGKQRSCLRGFCHYLHREVRCRTSRLQDYRVTGVQTSFSPSIKCNVLREGLSEDSQNIPCATPKEKWVVVFSTYFWAHRRTIVCMRLFPRRDDLHIRPDCRPQPCANCRSHPSCLLLCPTPPRWASSPPYFSSGFPASRVVEQDPEFKMADSDFGKVDSRFEIKLNKKGEICL
jgi:hypothetical protein